MEVIAAPTAVQVVRAAPAEQSRAPQPLCNEGATTIGNAYPCRSSRIGVGSRWGAGPECDETASSRRSWAGFTRVKGIRPLISVRARGKEAELVRAVTPDMRTARRARRGSR